MHHVLDQRRIVDSIGLETIPLLGVEQSKVLEQSFTCCALDGTVKKKCTQLRNLWIFRLIFNPPLCRVFTLIVN